ncbi:MAG: four helix bundle protein [Bacteroidales bacterium]|nr:four helix bundle protein [Bacteroidales bacterium]
MNYCDNRKFGLEGRTFKFAKLVREFVKKLPKTVANFKDIDQLVRSSGSVAANFIEAIDAISGKDREYRYKICRKESKESNLWLKLIDTNNIDDLNTERVMLAQEAYELTRIFGSLVYR